MAERDGPFSDMERGRAEVSAWFKGPGGIVIQSDHAVRRQPQKARSEVPHDDGRLGQGLGGLGIQTGLLQPLDRGGDDRSQIRLLKDADPVARRFCAARQVQRRTGLGRNRGPRDEHASDKSGAEREELEADGRA